MAMALVMLVLVIHGPSAGGPREPIVLRIDEVAVAEIDPAKSTDFVDSILFYNLYDTLVAAAPGGKLVPSLAESWTVSPDGLAYAFISTTDAGSGPYRIKAHNPQQLSVIEKFPGYWQAFAANAPDEVRVLLSVEAATIRTLMVRREHDVTSQWLPTEIYRALGDTPGIALATERGQSNLFLKINTKRAPTDDLNVRRAMVLGFDYAAVLRLIQINDRVAAGKTARGPIPEGFPGFDPTLPVPKRDVAAAKAALAQAKSKNVELE